LELEGPATEKRCIDASFTGGKPEAEEAPAKSAASEAD
jgi:hypothetical protein